MTLIEGAGNCPGTTPVCENLQGLEGLGRMLAQRSSFQPGDPAQRRLPEGGPFSRQPQHVAAEDPARGCRRLTDSVFAELPTSTPSSPLKNPHQLPSLQPGFLNLTCPSNPAILTKKAYRHCHR